MDVYPDTAHIRHFGLKSAPDLKVWAHAEAGGYTIVNKDADFHHRRQIAELLISRRDEIDKFEQSVEQSFLALV